METANQNPSPADIQRAKDNADMEKSIMDKVEKKVEEAKKQDSQEPILVTDATKGILARQGITNVITQEELDKREKDIDSNTVVNTVKDAINKPAETEEQQVNKAEVNDESIDLTEAEYEALERAGVTEEQILGNDDSTVAQIKELAQNQLKKEQEEAKPSQDQNSMVISDEYAEQLALTYPFAKSLKGKTMEEVMGILSKQNSYITKLENSKGVQEDNSDVDKTNSQTDNSETDLSDEEVVDLLNLTPEEATKKLKLLAKQMAKAEVQTEVAKEVKKLLPNLEGLQEVSNEKYEAQFYSELGKQLPEDADVKEIVKNWKTVNKDMPKESKLALANNVDLLITTIAKDHKLGLLSKENTVLNETKDSEVKKQTFNKVKELIKQSKTLGMHNGQFNFKRKNIVDISGEPQNAEEELYDKMIRRNLNRL
jgi:hypothetical protein